MELQNNPLFFSPNKLNRRRDLPVSSGGKNRDHVGRRNNWTEIRVMSRALMGFERGTSQGERSATTQRGPQGHMLGDCKTCYLTGTKTITMTKWHGTGLQSTE